ncbi:MAG: hypothetical protein AB1758_32620, partial [Candidatus Eremiobacterota bacterium]
QGGLRPPPSHPRRGVSLLETLIAAGLLALLLTYVYQFLVAATRYQKGCMAALELQKQSLTGMSALTAELSESAYASVKDDPPGLIFASPRDANGKVSYDGSGRVLWRCWVGYYPDMVNGRPCLVRKTLPINPPGATPPSPDGQSTAAFRSLQSPVKTRVVHLRDRPPWSGGGFSLAKVPAPTGGRGRVDLVLRCRRVELGEAFELELKSTLELMQ